jgi:hypothetical protein
VGTPSDSDLTLSPGAGYGEKGDALNLGPAQERLAPLPAQPKPTNLEAATSDDVPSPIIALETRRTKKSAAAEATAVPREAEGLVTVRPKPEKRKNAKERAKEKYAKKSTEDGTTPTMTAKAKSKVDKKADTKAKKSKAA